ncbi:DUF4870 domain-containing protein [Chitinophaga sp. Hz27]|uniref:DUF4870 domain-containing protein n=1 Tax=Chitinophaga sp. Hz27 TaxID=3347169 RepID=UPI0035D5ACF8
MMNERDERTWVTLLHLSGLLGYYFFGWAGNVLLVFILWLIKRSDSTFVDEQGKEALNFQLTISILSLILVIVAGIITGIWAFGNAIIFGGGMHVFHFGLSFGGIYSILKIVNLVFSIIAAIAANKGEHYRYPIAIRLVK